MNRRSSGIAALSVVAAIGLASCREGAMPVSTDRVQVDEFSIHTAAQAWTAGALELTIDNVGERAHTLIISRDDGQVVAASDIVDPEQVIEFDVDLGPGTYQLTCRIVVEGGDGQLFDHFEQGMHATIEVGA